MTNPVITTDGFAVTPSEATELCIHHLRLAFMFYLSSEGDTPEKNEANLFAEITRQANQRGATDWELHAIEGFIEGAVTGDKESRDV